MAHGEVAVANPSALGNWDPQVGPTPAVREPLTSSQREFLDDVIYRAELSTGLRFSVYLGDLGENTRATADNLLSGLGVDAPSAVLLAVSPGQHVVEVVTGTEAVRRVSDRAARLAVLAVVASCSEGDLPGALATGVRILADQAGILPERATW